MAHIDFSHGGNIHEFKGRKIIDFSASINPLGLPQNLKNSLRGNIDGVLHYPENDGANLAGMIAARMDIRKENILIGNGSAELIYLITYAFKPESVLIPSPTFSEYERAATAYGSKIKFLKLNPQKGFMPVQESVGADILFICRPNNPTGNMIFEDFERIEQSAGKIAVIDEAFMDFLPEDKNISLLKRAAESEKLIVLRTFTKFFAIPGLRIGYAAGRDDNIAKLRKHCPPWNVNSLAIIAAGAALENTGYAKKTREFIKKERAFLFNEISEINNLTPHPSLANFILIELDSAGFTSSTLQEKLISEGILVRDCKNFRGLSNSYIRVAVRTRRENKSLIKALRKAM